MAALHAASHTGNYSGQSNMLSGPSRKANVNAPSAASSASGTLSKPDYPPKLTEEEKTLLHINDGCLKCRKPFVYHIGSDNAPGCTYPVGTGYKPVTFTTINAARPAGQKTKVAAVVPTDMNNFTSFQCSPCRGGVPWNLQPR